MRVYFYQWPCGAVRVAPMRRMVRPLDRRAGAVLDTIVGAALVLLGAFALDAVGITFREILAGSAHFFGL